jgi:exodeoxyribonuclease V alpha subunit
MWTRKPCGSRFFTARKFDFQPRHDTVCRFLPKHLMQHQLPTDIKEIARLTLEVQSVVFANEENGWAVIRGTSPDEPGVVSAVGLIGEVSAGELLEMTGQWKEHPKFGRQFDVESAVRTYPATENGIIRYLSSGMIRGVGKTMAKRMVATFGADVLDILDTDPKKLLNVEGIGRKKLERIRESWDSQRDIRSLMLFLQTHGIPTTFAGRIFKLWGAGSEARLKENPYELAYEIRGIGFRKADEMALKLGFAVDSRERVEAACVFSLFTMGERGHLFCPAPDLFGKVWDILGEVSEEGFDDALAVLEERKRIRIERLAAQGIDRAVYLHHFYTWERKISQRLYHLIAHPCPETTRKKVDKMVPELERDAGLALSSEQREAVLEACGNKVFIITGGPGTGKTTITRMIVRALSEAGLKLKLAAPTGRAAKRLSEASGMSASTIHRLLQYSPDTGFQLGEDNKLKADALVVDEASMLDAGLFNAVLSSLPMTCRLILVGDVNQLPSVGPGHVLSDLLTSETIPCARLTQIFRQAMQSHIVLNAHKINQGEFPSEAPDQIPPGKDFWWITQDDPARVQALVRQCVCDRIPAAYGMDPMRDVQVLTPMHKGDVGTHSLNQMLQNGLNPARREFKRGNQIFREGDRVLQLRNDYDKEVFNGDMGWVDQIDFESGELSVDFDGRIVAYESTELDELTLAYAVSVHKSQGSEYRAVVIPMVTQHYVLLQRNLLYTALTRARELAIIVGSRKAVGIALANNKSDERFTNLRFMLLELFNA